MVNRNLKSDNRINALYRFFSKFQINFHGNYDNAHAVGDIGNFLTMYSIGTMTQCTVLNVN